MAGELLIAAPIPAFLSQSTRWFRKNQNRIRHGGSLHPFWERNTFEISKEWSEGMRVLTERLVTLGYTATPWPEQKGEFTIRGGTVILFPVNEMRLYRVDFFGNTIDEISILRESRDTVDARTLNERKLIEYLENGDYVVHQDHGVGIWRGVVREGHANYFSIEYRGPRDGAPDMLLVPTAEEKRITPYIGFRTPPVTRLGTPVWKRILKKTKEDTFEFAKKLLTTHALREITKRSPYIPYRELEEKIASDFPHTETESQLRALGDIMNDLEASSPMDRMLVGDVGFGKTEIAFRASVRIAANGKQTAILAPTTLLADQHYHTWARRLKNSPLVVTRLSRLESVSEKQKIIRRIRDGTVDIIVGTHRLLSRDVVWHNLGLLIIDEEQRFGVEAKEHLKNIKGEIDVLTMSATPLPRTLSLALSHLKRISMLEEAPRGRRTPHTFVLPYSEHGIQRAVEHELERKGQIYFLEGRIRHIPRTLETLTKLAPKRRIGYIHGRLGEKILVETMEKFRAGEIEILISTTIIENGIDLSSVNTLIVSDSTLFGLSELHQLRGRIGRGREESFAYFLYATGRLGNAARRRLDVLSSTQFLGAGPFIAERDLEMRGAGNILGREQSGTARLVGLNLYSQFLAEAVEKLRSSSDIH